MSYLHSLCTRYERDYLFSNNMHKIIFSLTAQLWSMVSVNTSDDGSMWQVIYEYQVNGVTKNITSPYSTLNFYSTFASIQIV